MNIYQIEDGETHWFAAKSKNDALEQYASTFFGIGGVFPDLKENEHLLPCALDEIEVTKMDDDQILTLSNEMDGGEESHPASKWIEIYGSGPIGTTCY